MTTLEHLDRWLAEGKFSAAQHETIGALVRKDRVSVFLELNALLYLGVLSFAGGLAWTVNAYAAQWGDLAILLPVTALVVGSFYYCFSRVAPYSTGQVPSPSLVFDYVLYLACLAFAVELGYVEYRFHLLQARWDDYLLASSVAYFALAYRFDNRFVLSLAIATLGGWFGVRFTQTTLFLGESIRLLALTYGLVVAVTGIGLHTIDVKRHFLDSYLHVAANVVLAALLWSALDVSGPSMWLAALLVASAAAVAGGTRFRRFAFVVYGVGYGWVGISGQLLRIMHDPTQMLTYVVISAGLVVVGLVVLSHRFGSET